MDRSSAVARRPAALDRLGQGAERILRLGADPRLGLALLLVAGAWNAVAAAVPDGGPLLDGAPYVVLLGAILLSGLAAVAVRLPAAWREWRRPGLPPVAEGALVRELELEAPPGPAERAALTAVLRRNGYRVREHHARGRWGLAAVRRGWSRFAGLGSHLALVLLVLGAAVGTAFSSETTFSLLPGQQALLDAPRPGFTDAVRLDGFHAEFGTDGRPRRLDTAVTFLRDGEAVQAAVLQVNRPGEFGGYLVHGWTYGPAATLRVTSLAGRPLADAPLALDRSLNGRPYAELELPSAGLRVTALLIDAEANRLRVGVASGARPLDAGDLDPGQTVRLGAVEVRHLGMTSYVTFLSRRDPGMPLLFGGAALLTACLAVAFWLPRRRLGLVETDAGLRLVLRGERFDRPARELDSLAAALRAALGATTP
ncbi:MAG TPA: cytochrome c biogenesis protein ResB [candidate division Zixibacteria bacterium]|nr:cytochrome c biogenesis protein ResB [candidate division Zixibacteria bacterium]